MLRAPSALADILDICCTVNITETVPVYGIFIFCSCQHIKISHTSCELLYISIALQHNGKIAVNYVARDFRVRRPETQIIRLTKATVEQYDKMCNVQKPSSELQSYVIVIT